MNLEKVFESARSLEHIAQELSKTGDHEVQMFYSCIKPIIEGAKAGEINLPMEWREIPGQFYFLDGGLRKYRDLERAFAEFRLVLTCTSSMPFT